MIKSKPQFRAIRETLGYTQLDVAEALGVERGTIKNWEKETCPWEIPSDAWDWLLSERTRFEEMYSYSVCRALDSGAEKVVLAYYRTQEIYDSCGRDKGAVGFANALARAVAHELEAEGLDVEFRYPDKAIRTPGSRY